VADAPVFELFARLVVALAIVIGLMVLSARVLKKRGIDLSGGGRRNGGTRPAVEVIARRGLAKNASVAVVRAGGKTLVLGVTDQRVTMLTEADLTFDVDLDRIASDRFSSEEAQWTGSPMTSGSDARGGSPWKMALETLRDRTVRRD
jgi:flagellar biogenesis protein FliO